MKILITGATGLIGKEIIRQCRTADIPIHFLTTSAAKLSKETNEKGFLWNPSNKEIDLKAFEGVTHIINLAGSTIAQRWTKSNKEKIVQSRIESIETLKKGIASLQNHELQYFLGASAIGYYPSSFTEDYTAQWDLKTKEDSFLRSTVLSWEQANQSMKASGLKVGQLRIGLVLDHTDGALPKFVTPVKWFVGAAFGSGNQWQSWIHKTDLANMFLHMSKNKTTGILNGVAPRPVTQSALVKAIANQLNKPLLLPNVPAFVMVLVLGKMAQLVLESQKVSPDQWHALGFEFQFSELRAALKDLLS